MVLSKGSLGRLLGVAALTFFCCSLAHASGGACPASSPLAGNTTCFFISSTGVDTNTGLDEAHAWLHSPGMINCSANCATEQTGLGGSKGNGGQSHPGVGFIFRGGDTWHFSNPSPGDGMPYTGGEMYSLWGSNDAAHCVYEGTQTGCFYWGVDTTWYNSSVCGGSWCRPIFNGDNPVCNSTSCVNGSTSTMLVNTCTYATRTTNPFDRTNSTNVLFMMANDLQGGVYLDGIEFTGLCSDDTSSNFANDAMLVDGSATSPITFKNNLYFHGWSVTVNEVTNQSHSTQVPDCVAINGGSLSAISNTIIDGADSNPATCIGMAFGNPLHVKNSIFRYNANPFTGAHCHDWHDNIFEYLHAPNPPTHGNVMECNADDSNGTANVFYNNIARHFDPSWSTGGEVGWWFCPNTTPEYWFNNLQYDMVASHGVMWSVVGPPTYGGCPNTGGQFEFNNTIVDSKIDCAGTNDNTGGQYMTMLNNHMINAGYSGTTCHGGPNSQTNVAMSDATATSQGYTTGSSGTAGTGNNCANDSTTPCSPTAANNGTVGAGGNYQPYCTTLASYTSEPAIGTDAAIACQYGTTNACSYNTSTHTMSCPGQTAVVRPVSGAWDSGAYEFNTQDPPPSPPTALKAVVN